MLYDATRIHTIYIPYASCVSESNCSLPAISKLISVTQPFVVSIGLSSLLFL